jgi:hypothetical protein
VISGWLALSSYARIDSTAAFPEFQGYPRTAVQLRGSPEMGVLPRMIADGTAEPGHELRHAAIYDDPTPGQGYPLLVWKLLPPYTVSPADVPATDIMLLWDLEVLHAINGTAASGGVSACCEPARGDRVGTINCQTVFAGVRLSIAAGQICRRGSVKLAMAAQ